MTKLLWVTNIPAPYRNLRYRRFNTAMRENGIDFHVSYMAWTEPGRHWRFTDDDLDHPHSVHAGLHLRVRGTTAHVNPGLIWSALRRRHDVWVVGGYDNPTSVLLVMISRLMGWLRLPRPALVLASESNISPHSAVRGISGRVKRFCVASADAYVGPGSLAREALVAVWPPAQRKPFFILPNVIDEDVFDVAVGRRRHDSRASTRSSVNVSEDEQMWLLPARLEPFKGIREFFEYLPEITGVRVVVVGTGSEEASLKRVVEDRGLGVTFLGQADQDAMVELYAAADVFVLPSLRDPSPLSAVEALAAALPIVLSERAGNHPEILANDNGWLFRPSDPEATSAVIKRVSSMVMDELRSVGGRSKVLFDQEFRSTRCTARFGQEMATWLRSRSTRTDA